MIDFEHIINNVSCENFDDFALQIFEFQSQNCSIYKQFIDYLGLKPHQITTINKIPFLPIEFFKNHKVVCFDPKLIDQNTLMFKSSGTTFQTRSVHYVYSPQIYHKSFMTAFKKVFGEPKDLIILALLPSYLEAGNSSLVYMVDYLIKSTQTQDSGFYLNNYNELAQKLMYLDPTDKQVILFGVSYALLEMKNYSKFNLKNTIIVETGGMKGKAKEITRQVLHNKLFEIYGTDKIYSEYGMTELLSQAYCTKNELFEPASTMKVLIRDHYDPFSYLSDGISGGINVIDLANIYSCSFIETKDLGKKQGNFFEVLGRIDNSDIRGCNLLTLE